MEVVECKVEAAEEYTEEESQITPEYEFPRVHRGLQKDIEL